MAKREFETSSEPQSRPAKPVGEWDNAADIERTAQVDLLVQHLAQSGSSAKPDAQAALLNHAAAGNLSRAPQAILQLQRSYGNRHVQQVVRAARQGASSPVPVVQAKLTLGPPGDKYEQQADRVAKQVVNHIHQPATEAASGQPSVQRQKFSPKKDEALQRRPAIQRMPTADGTAIEPTIESAIQQARGGGRPLPDNIRRPMEHAFGADFSGVKIHMDTRSDGLNQSIQAKAFTTGQDIFFSQGAYNPGSRNGQELLAHELTHVVQQANCAHRMSPESLFQMPISHPAISGTEGAGASVGIIQRTLTYTVNSTSYDPRDHSKFKEQIWQLAADENWDDIGQIKKWFLTEVDYDQDNLPNQYDRTWLKAWMRQLYIWVDKIQSARMEIEKLNPEIERWSAWARWVRRLSVLIPGLTAAGSASALAYINRFYRSGVTAIEPPPLSVNLTMSMGEQAYNFLGMIRPDLSTANTTQPNLILNGTATGVDHDTVTLIGSLIPPDHVGPSDEILNWELALSIIGSVSVGVGLLGFWIGKKVLEPTALIEKQKEYEGKISETRQILYNYLIQHK